MKKKSSPLWQRLNYLKPKETYSNDPSQLQEGDRECENVYRKRRQHDRVVRSTHGVNCTGSCSWNIFVKDGIVTWEAQSLDYPHTGPDRPDIERRASTQGAS